MARQKAADARLIEAPQPCPRCGKVSEAALWPFLKGTLEEGKEIAWRRCLFCQALFSELTRDHLDGKHEDGQPDRP
jgi:hypothetical protein